MSIAVAGLSQDASLTSDTSQTTTSGSQLACRKCGSIDMTEVGNHWRCNACRTFEKTDGVDWSTAAGPLYPTRVVYAGFVAGAVGIIERDLAGSEVASRSATKQEKIPANAFRSALARLLSRRGK